MTDPSYIDADAATLRRTFAIADGDEPDVLVVDGRWSARALAADVARTWPSARELDERTSLVEVAGRRAWITGAFGAAQAATYAHLAVRLGARAVVQVGSFGGLVADWAVGDVLVPSSVVGRDGVSRQLTRGEPVIPDPSLTDRLRRALAAADVSVRNGTLLSTTTIALERRSDIVRWGHAGYVGVEMEAAATLAVAAHFGVPASAALFLFDNLAAGRSVFDQTDDERMRCRFSRERTLRAAVASAIQSVS